MKIPGFTAEASLLQKTGSYQVCRVNGVSTIVTTQMSVIPQFITFCIGDIWCCACDDQFCFCGEPIVIHG